MKVRFKKRCKNYPVCSKFTLPSTNKIYCEECREKAKKETIEKMKIVAKIKYDKKKLMENK